MFISQLRCARPRTWVALAGALVLLPGIIALVGGCAEDHPTPLATSDTEIAAAKPTGGSNCLSFPVIWAEGVTKVLPGTPGVPPMLNGEWWYWWGTEGVDPNIVPLACAPVLNPADTLLCLDGSVPGEGYEEDLVKAYLQKDNYNLWQAGSGLPGDFSLPEAPAVYVDWIDWGDNLESVDWYMTSQVRTEVVLFEENPLPDFVPTPEYTPWLEYGMRHTSGWGQTEVHGLATSLDDVPEIGSGAMATVYSPCARFMIQRLLVDRDDPRLADLIWVPTEGWTEPEGYPDDLINDPIFNGAAHEAGDGPGYYSAEINVKGRIIYGYTWNVRRLNDGQGDYRLTFSFDESCGGVALNTAFIDGHTNLIVPLEEEATDGESPGGGGTAVLDFSNNLTYMDIHILARGGGGGGGREDKPGGGGGGKGGGGGNH